MNIRAAFLIVLVAGLAGAAELLGLLVPFDSWVADKTFQTDRRAPSGEVVLVEIDARSLSAIGTWPWPRSVHADIIDRLSELGAAEIALDIDFSASSTEAGDAALEAALRRAGGSVILASFFQFESSASGAQIIFNRPIPRFADNAWLGTVNIRPGSDGSIRSASFGELIDAVPVLSIPALLSGRSGAIGSEFLIDFSIAAEDIDRISAIDLMEGRVDPSRVAGRKILVAASAVELGDYFEVPVYGTISGGLIQALAAETLIQDRGLVAADSTVVLAGLGLLAILAVLAISSLPWTKTVASVVAIGVGIEIAAFVISSSAHTIIPTAAWQLALLGFGAVCMAREIDLRGLAESIFRRESINSREVLNRVVEDSSAGVVVTNQDGEIIHASKAVARILSLPLDTKLVGRRGHDVLPEQISTALTDVVRTYPMPTDIREFHVDDADGKRIVLEVTCTASQLVGKTVRPRATSEAEIVGCVTFIDVTEKRQLEARTAHLARFDSLTGLPNRHHFIEKLQSTINNVERSPSGAALLLFDIDRFKNVNDTLGHHFGDLLLKAIAERTGEVLQDSGFLARLGGDEFAVIAPNLSRAEIEVVAGQITDAMFRPFILDGYRAAIGASAGITMVGSTNVAATEVLKQADLALNVAKSDNSGFRFFDAGMDSDLDERRLVEVALWDALRNGQLHVEYQPQVDLVTGRIIGFEALSRWTHAELGQIAPDRFIAIAETTGLIEPIGAAVLANACRDIAQLPDNVNIAVNVSPVQFVRGDLTQSVADALSSSGLDPSRLELEITESLFLTKGSLVADKIRDLTSLGVSLSLDDFGTGYSSLNYVREFPIDKIKIDRTFVTNLLVDEGSSAIVRAVVALADGLHKSVIAEGIETEEQASALRLLGCREGQGYLFGKAMPSVELTRYLQTQAFRPEPQRLIA